MRSAPGLVKLAPAVARLFCLALPGSFLTMFCAELSRPRYIQLCFTFGYQEDGVLCRDLHVRVELDQRPQPRQRDPRRELLVGGRGGSFGHFELVNFI